MLEKIESERYPYFSASAPLIGTLAIALQKRSATSRLVKDVVDL
jgi:hypothetical protein